MAAANGEAEKEGFEPSRQGLTPPNALAGRRLQPLGHFSGRAKGTAPLFLLRSKSPFGGMAGKVTRGMLKKPAPLEFPSNSPSRHSRSPSCRRASLYLGLS